MRSARAGSIKSTRLGSTCTDSFRARIDLDANVTRRATRSVSSRDIARPPVQSALRRARESEIRAKSPSSGNDGAISEKIRLKKAQEREASDECDRPR